jgi:hypothetical protein
MISKKHSMSASNVRKMIFSFSKEDTRQGMFVEFTLSDFPSLQMKIMKERCFSTSLATQL